ncbi:DUF5420 family protein [Photorhabdus sp. APURE]|uniref:DUF5420 family protein n=1 Tax=Photorhabdus aballayi TaxID=2991723 RepID=UPI00223E1B10|nr:DUF5420 family protein [Photorhabdus aballayi]MCW7548431.1 DUF5420 family protein [Photorhabdus aballayi]
MSERDFKYYRLTGDIVKQIDDEFQIINEKRAEVFKAAKDSVGAKGATFQHGIGANGTLIDRFAFPIEKEFDFAVKIIVKNDELKVVSAKSNSKAGKEFNKKIADLTEETNRKLKNLPAYKDFLIEKFNISCTTLGTPKSNQRGVPVISTLVGKASKDKSIILFAIPIAEKEDWDKRPKIPECFEEITYGTFYDLSE